MIKIVVQAFYAIHDTWTPVVIGFFSLLLNIACNFLFFRWLRNGGPALATSLAAFFDTFVLMLVFRYRHGTLGLREVIRSATKFVVASLVMGAVVYMFMDIPGVYTGDWVERAFGLAVAIILAAGVYFGVVRLLRARELQEMWGIYGQKTLR
jgi:putative peptidoglycan lipid II flippase